MCLKSSPLYHSEFSFSFETWSLYCQCCFLPKNIGIGWNHNFCREAVWFIEPKGHAQASIGLFPDVCPLTNCLIFLEKGDHNDDLQMCGGCSGGVVIATVCKAKLQQICFS